MTFRDNAMAVLRYQKYDKLPVVSFGYWGETVQKWADEGHITREEADDYCRHGDNGWGDRSIMKKLGFDFNWNSCIASASDLFPSFEEQTLEERPDGSRVIRDGNGLIVLVKPGIVSIPAEIGTRLPIATSGRTNTCPACASRWREFPQRSWRRCVTIPTGRFLSACTAARSWDVCAICSAWSR